MALSPQEKTILYNEIINDPESLGYSGKTNVEIAAIMNTPGTASPPNRVLIASEVPVFVKGTVMASIIAQIDGLMEPVNPFGAGLAHLLDWVETSRDPYAIICRFFLDPGADFDVAGAEGRGVIDYLAGVQVAVGQPPTIYTLLSDAAMTALLELGMILMSRAREIMSRPVTEQDIIETLAP